MVELLLFLLRMLNKMPLERQAWIEEGEELGKEVNSVHVGLNVTESKQDGEDSSRDLKPGRWKG